MRKHSNGNGKDRTGGNGRKSSNGNGNGKDFSLLEKEIRARYGEDGPSVLEPRVPVNREGRFSLWNKKQWMWWGVFALAALVFLLPKPHIVSLNGKVVAREMRVIVAKTGGEIVSLAKSSGDAVKEGEVIGRIRNSSLEEEKRSLSAEIKVFETDREGLAKNSEVGRKMFAAYKRLYEERDLARLQFEAEEMKLKELERLLSVKEAEIEERKVRLANLESRMKSQAIVSSVEGAIVSSLEEKLHSHVKEGEAVAEVAFGGKQFEFFAEESVLALIRPGLEISVRLRAFPEKKFQARVDDIRSLVLEERPKPWLKTYNGRVMVSALESLPDDVRIGMSASAKVLIYQHRRAAKIF